MKPGRLSTLAARYAAVFSIAVMALPGTSRAAERQDGIGRRDVRSARTALDEGRWSEGLEIYEAVLQSPLARDPELRDEALFSTALILLSSDAGSDDVNTAADRLETLAARKGHGKDLEITALRTLLDSLDEERIAKRELSDLLNSERMAMEDERQRAVRAMAKRDEALEQQRKRNKALRKLNKKQLGELETLEREIENRDAVLAQRDADVDFLTTQLEGTHQDQAQLLAAVITKNEELRTKERQLQATRIALQQRESKLEAQAEELSEQEKQLRKREEAIREVTDRILAKDQPDP